MSQRPPQWSRENADAFKDPGVVAAYSHRPAPPPEVVERILALLGDGPRRVLDLGCGPGTLARLLAPHVDHVDAVDPSEAMIAAARATSGEHADRIAWHCATAEAFPFDGPYSAVITAESIHWMDWDAVVPKIAAALAPDGRWVILMTRDAGSPWSAELRPLYPFYSAMQDFVAADAVHVLVREGRYTVEDRILTEPALWRLSVDDYVEYHHSMSGLARYRLDPARAAAFDAEVRGIVAPYARDGALTTAIQADMTWGRPPG